jgi:hypothetical protein
MFRLERRIVVEAAEVVGVTEVVPPSDVSIAEAANAR